MRLLSIEKIRKDIKKGFTLVETLTAVLILIVLISLISIPINSFVSNTEQTKLDNMAQTIYVTAQNNLTKMIGAGRVEEIRYDRSDLYMRELAEKPSDYSLDTYDRPLTVISYDSAKCNLLVPNGSVDKNGRYIIEYDSITGDVHAVFYYVSDDYINGFNFYEGKALVEQIRQSKESRINAGNKIGYYSGEVRDAEGIDTTKISSDIIIFNKEELKALFDINMPIGHEEDDIEITITITGNASGVEKVIVHETSNEFPDGLKQIGEEKGLIRQYELLIDNLETHKFKDNYEGFLPGEDITIGIKVKDLSYVYTATSQSTPEIVNSLFASVKQDNSHDVVNIEYVRHLENLNDYKPNNKSTGSNQITVKQIKDLGFDNGFEDEYKDVYGSRKHTPIKCDYIYIYDGQGYYIDNLTTTYTTNSGLFDTFSGEKLANIIMRNAEINGTNVGSLTGIAENKGSNKVTIDNCYSYLTASHYNKSASENIYISGTNAGGLIGKTNDTNIEINKSFASTVIKGTSYAGGLVGCGSNDLTINSCYTDSYISTSSSGKVGGIAASADPGTTIIGSYVAGYLNSDADTVAGFIPSYISTVNNSYSIFNTINYSVGKNKGYSIAPRITNVSEVYYADMPNLANETTAKKTALDKLKTLASTLGNTYFYTDLQNNTAVPYKMSTFADALPNSYPYPTIKLSFEGLHANEIKRHYGDWTGYVEISGNLAYYEIYRDGTFGFYTIGANKLNEYKDILYDGYCLIYEYGDIENANQDKTIILSVNGGSETQYVVEGSTCQTYYADDYYYMKPLPNSIINKGQDANNYYYKLVIKNETLEDEAFYFNPGYAKAIDTENGTIPEVVSIRTARHTNFLANNYINSLSGVNQTTFRQERNINYQTYKWEQVGYSNTTSQGPIGNKNNPFVSIYDGGYNKITGLSLTKDSSTNETGFFGRISETAIIKDLFLSNVDKTNTINNTTSNGEAFVGALVAYNEGTIENCIADNFNISVEVSNATQANVGGLVGRNEGYINNASANMPIFNVKATSSLTYVGGLVGYNAQNIKYSYAMGAIEADKYTGGSMYVGGFVGYNNSTSYAYSTTAIKKNDNSINVYGFAPKNGTSLYCYYIDNGNYTYNGNDYKYDFNTSISSGTAKSYRNLASGYDGSINIKNFAKAESVYDSIVSGNNFPFLTSIVDYLGKSVHYGEWLVEKAMGEVGFYYWEIEDGEYHIHAIASESGKIDSEYNTLCNDYDCHKKITDYGYGYYVLSESEHTTHNNVQWFNTNVSDSYLNATASAQVKAILGAGDAYEFYSYTSGQDKVYATSTNNAAMEIEVVGETHRYEFSPLFGDCLAKTAPNAVSSIDYLQTRSIEQLQYINWYYTNDYKSAKYYENQLLEDRWMTSDIYATADNFLYQNKTFKQTHNIEAKGYSDFVPIFTTSNSLANLAVGLSGMYDGQSYEINNLNINSTRSTVGLFGIVNGGKIKNIILHKTSSSASDAVIYKTGDRPTSNNRVYYVGTIAGLVYGDQSVDNCVVSGYTITDNTITELSSNNSKSFFGGIVGYAKTVNNCAFVANIIENAYMLSLNFSINDSHIGGITGAAVNINNCYSGGSTTINTQGTLITNRERFNYGGIVGGTNANIGASNITLNNCYTYMTLSVSGEIDRLKSLGVLATTSESNITLYINNSYYDSSINCILNANSNKINANTNYFTKNSGWPSYREEDVKASGSISINAMSTKDYNGFSADSFITTLGSGTFARADNTYPISEPLSGKNYPFPAVVVRNNKKVHYGDWPATLSGITVSDKNLNLDLYSRTNSVADSSKTIVLRNYDDNGQQININRDNVSIEASDYVTYTLDSGYSATNYNITFTAKSNGTDTITITYGDKSVDVNITVTGDIAFEIEEADPNQTLYDAYYDENALNKKQYILTVTDTKGNLISNLSNDKWTFIVNDAYIGGVKTTKGIESGAVAKMTSGENAGKYLLTVTSYDDDNPDYIDTKNTSFTIGYKNVPSTVSGISMDTTMITQPVDVYPRLEKVNIQYYDGSNLVHTDEVDFGGNVAVYDITQNAELLDGRTFNHWVNVNDVDDIYVIGEDEVINVRKTVKLKAVYDSFVISIYDDTDNYLPMDPLLVSKLYYSGNFYTDVELQVKVDEVPVTNKIGHSFVNAYSKEDGTKILANSNKKIIESISSFITQDRDFYITWNCNFNKIEFYADKNYEHYIDYINFSSGEATTTRTVPDSPIYELPNEFFGWALPNDVILINPDNTINTVSDYYDGTKWTIDEDFDLYAIIEKTNSSVTLLRGYGSTEDLDYTKVEFIKTNENKLKSSSGEHEVINREHYNLLGYYENADKIVNADGTLVASTVYADADAMWSKDKTVDATFTANWDKIDTHVTFKGNVDTEVDGWIIKDTSTITSDQIIYKTGYTFEGYTVTDPYNSNQIKIVNSDGTFVTDVVIHDVNGNAITLTDSEGKFIYDPETIDPGIDFVFNAIETAVEYQIIYSSNSAEASGSVEPSNHVYDEPKALNKNNFTRRGYKFLGWSTNRLATEPTYVDKQTVTNLSTTSNSVTLYAVWRRAYVLTLNNNTFTSSSAVEYVIENGTGLDDFENFVNNVAYDNSRAETGYTLTGYHYYDSVENVFIKIIDYDASTDTYSIVPNTIRSNENGEFDKISNDLMLYAGWKKNVDKAYVYTDSINWSPNDENNEFIMINRIDEGNTGIKCIHWYDEHNVHQEQLVAAGVDDPIVKEGTYMSDNKTNKPTIYLKGDYESVSWELNYPNALISGLYYSPNIKYKKMDGERCYLGLMAGGQHMQLRKLHTSAKIWTYTGERIWTSDPSGTKVIAFNSDGIDDYVWDGLKDTSKVYIYRLQTNFDIYDYDK